jgi:hypothetical protein
MWPFRNFLKNHWTGIAYIYMKAFWYIVHSNLFKSWSLGPGGATMGKIIFTFKFSFSRPIWIKLGTNYPWIKGIQNCTNKGTGPLERRDNHKNANKGWGHLKIFFKNCWARRAHIYKEVFWQNVDSSLFKSGVESCSRENHIYMCLY